MGNEPYKWGAQLWQIIHRNTFAYPERVTDKDKYEMYMHFTHLKVPCEKCQTHYRANLKKLPLTDKILRKKDRLIRWGIDMHNLVNMETGKKVLTYEEAINKIMQYL